MRFSWLQRFAILTAVVLGTWFGTSALMQRNTQAQDSPSDPVAKVASSPDGGGTDAVRGRGKPVVTRTIKNVEVSSGRLVSGDIRLQGGSKNVVAVSAEADLVDKRKSDIYYLWRVRVFADANPKGVHNFENLTLHQDHPYVTQKFRLPDGKTTMQPKFDDKFLLDPGRYAVMITLYEIPGDFDLDTLDDDPTREKSMHVVQYGKQVEIPE